MVIACVVALFALLFGYFFFTLLGFFLRQSTAASQLGASAASVNQSLVRPLVNNTIVLLMLLVVLITAIASKADESHGYTSGALRTYAGWIGLVLVALAVTLIDIGALFVYGQAEWQPVASAYAGLVLFGGGLLAIGLLISTLIANRAAAFVATTTVFALLWVATSAGTSSPTAFTGLIKYLSLTDHFDDFSKGVLDTTHVVFFLSLVILGLLPLLGGGSPGDAATAPRQRASTAARVIGALIVCAAANLIGYRYHARWDITPNKLFSLSSQSRSVIDAVDSPVHVTVFARSSDFPRYQDVLREYEYASRQITADYIDPDANPSVAKANQVEQYGTILFNYKGRTERVLSDGEQEITSGFMRVVGGRRNKIYFTEGHGEKDTRSSNRDGYNAIAAALAAASYDVDTLTLRERRSVPDDAATVIIAGPKTDFDPADVDALERYLDAQGALIMLVDPRDRPGAQPLATLIGLAHVWGVALVDDIVIDVSGMGRLLGTNASVPIAAKYPAHAITKNGTFGLITAFPLARSATPVPGGVNGHVAHAFVETSAQSWAERDISGLLTSGRVSLDERQGDTKGPVEIGSAVSTQAADRNGPAVNQRGTRVVVLGDSDFAANSTLGVQGNRDMFLNIVAWTSQPPNAVVIPPKQTVDSQLTLTADQQRTVKWTALLIVPSIALIVGFVVGGAVAGPSRTTPGLPVLGTPSFRGIAMSKLTTQSTRLLCASVFFNHGKARDKVLEWLKDPNRAVAAELGIDMKLAAQVARFAETRDRRQWWLIAGLFVAAAAGALLMLAETAIPLAAALAGLAVIGVTVMTAKKQIQERNEFLPLFRAGQFDPAAVAQRFGGELKPTELTALPATEQNFFVYGGFMPFVGAGYDLGGWSVAIAADKSKDTLGVPVPIVPFTAGELYTAIDDEVEALGLPGMEAKDCYFANGSDLREDHTLLPDRFGRPAQFLDRAAAQRYAASDQEHVRHYRRYQIVDWGGELALSYFLRCALRGNTLFVETKRFILTPIASDFRVVDQSVGLDWKETIAVVIGSAIAAPFLLIAAPFFAFGAVTTRLHEWFGTEDKQRKEAIEKNPLFNYGATSSLRQVLGSTEYGHYFQKMDGDLFNKSIEREVLDSLITFLDEHGVETSDLKERQTTILNSGVIVQGGDVRADSLAVGAGARARANVKKVFGGKTAAAKGAGE